MSPRETSFLLCDWILRLSATHEVESTYFSVGKITTPEVVCLSYLFEMLERVCYQITLRNIKIVMVVLALLSVLFYFKYAKGT